MFIIPFRQTFKNELKKMKKITMITLVVLWISCLIILIIALTDIVPNNVFKEYRLAVGIGFISITGFLLSLYRKLINKP